MNTFPSYNLLIDYVFRANEERALRRDVAIVDCESPEGLRLHIHKIKKIIQEWKRD